MNALRELAVFRRLGGAECAQQVLDGGRRGAGDAFLGVTADVAGPDHVGVRKQGRGKRRFLLEDVGRIGADLTGIERREHRVRAHQRRTRRIHDDGADVVSLHAPGRSDGQPLLGAIELSRLAPGAIVVNTARASLVSAEAMLDALGSGQVGVYATDVFEQEPPLPSPLLAHPNVIRTSHIGGYTEESVTRATTTAVENLLRTLGPA